MNFYYAPMEGITLFPLRNIHRELFGDGIDKYYTPFLTAPATFHFKNREKKDVLPEKNTAFDSYGTQVIPQIMSGSAETFLWAARELKKLGYGEVNLNLGCPAPTVVSRRKGAGLLTDPDYLHEMLDAIFIEAENSDLYPGIAIKTRLGFSDPAEADRLMEIYASFPIKELIIHARVREDFYSGSARIDDFAGACRTYRERGGTAPICYNGNIGSVQDYEEVMDRLTIRESNGKECLVSSVMIGRGLLSDPSLVRQIRGGDKLSPEELKTYLRKLYSGYAQFIPEDRNVIFKMLEHWAFLHVHFRDCDKYLKAIRKSRSKDEYLAAVNNIFSKCEFI